MPVGSRSPGRGGHGQRPRAGRRRLRRGPASTRQSREYAARGHCGDRVSKFLRRSAALPPAAWRLMQTPPAATARSTAAAVFSWMSEFPLPFPLSTARGALSKDLPQALGTMRPRSCKAVTGEGELRRDPEAYDASILDRRSFIFLRFDATCLRAISFGRTHGQGDAGTERACRHLHQHSAGLHVGSAAGHPARPPAGARRRQRQARHAQGDQCQAMSGDRRACLRGFLSRRAGF